MKKKIFHWMISFGLLILSLIMLVPFIMMISTSLKTAEEINSSAFNLLPAVPHFENYLRAMSSGPWPRYFFNSVFC